MTRDYAKRKTRKKTKKNHIFLWFSLLLLFVISIAGLLMLNQHPRSILTAITPEPKATTPLPLKPKPPTKTVINTSPKFDFYNTSTPQKDSPKKTKKSGNVYEIEIATLDSFAAADRLKAELALLGFSASITPIYKQGVSKYYISIGPYDNKENANTDLQKLKNNHLNGKLKKTS
jgi:cell division protein FtsN